MDFDHVHPLPLLKAGFEASGAVHKYFQVESQFMAADGFVGSNCEILRKNAVRIVLENYKSENFDAFIPYLAMNYFDRYVSNHGLPLPHIGNRVRDEVFLISLCCLTIAWKMRDKFFSIPHFLEERSLDSKGEHIMKVELKVLEGFNWRIRSVTPFCFVDFYARFLSSRYGIRLRSINEIIVQTQGDIYFTQFKPSLVAACVLLAACSFLWPANYFESRRRITNEIERENRLYGSEIESNSSATTQMACLERIISVCVKNKILIESSLPVFGETKRARVVAGEPAITTGVSEIEEDQQMDFKIKWIAEEDESEDLTINSPLFQRRFYDSGEAGHNNETESSLNKCRCNVQ